jgi:hypothetical protein
MLGGAASFTSRISLDAAIDDGMVSDDSGRKQLVDGNGALGRLRESLKPKSRQALITR